MDWTLDKHGGGRLLEPGLLITTPRSATSRSLTSVIGITEKGVQGAAAGNLNRYVPLSPALPLSDRVTQMVENISWDSSANHRLYAQRLGEKNAPGPPSGNSNLRAAGPRR